MEYSEGQQDACTSISGLVSARARERAHFISNIQVMSNYVSEALGWVAIASASFFVAQPILFPADEQFTAGEDGVILYFFYTTWCGWSKKAWPHWNELKRLFETRHVTYGGREVSLVAVDAEKNPALAKQFHVVGYPSFRLRTPDQVLEYPGGPSVAKFRDFLTKTLGYEMVE
jgi:thiol-disulfide isomerase/thioredoxin